jgi:prolyl-tRNA synthetase
MVETPKMHTVPEVAQFLDVHPFKVIKTLLYEADGRPLAALIPGDRELNEAKLKNVIGASDLHLASPEQINMWTGASVGFSGPKGLDITPIIADNHLQAGTDWITGANQTDAHFLHIDLLRDVSIDSFTDLVMIRENDSCPLCQGKLSFHKGIEVGHVFQLGTKYSQAMQATYLDENGHDQAMVMGCYGIGVSRVVAAAIEQNHDSEGIIFPPSIAPFEVILIALNFKDQEVLQASEKIYLHLRSLGIEVLLDDRDERPGVKFKDADLLGFPIQLIVGGKGLQKGVVETKDRRTGQRETLPLDNFESSFLSWRTTVRNHWGLD